MHNKPIVLATLLLCGCLDFDRAREECVSKGNCLGTLTPVTVVSTSPDNQAVDAAVGSLLGATFSTQMDQGSVKVVIAPSIGLGGLQWEPGDTTFSVQPSTQLAYATKYSVTLTGRSKEGVALGEDAKFSFTTGAEPDKVAPTLSATSPQSGTQNVPVDFKVVLTFSEAMDPSVSLMSQPPFLFGAPSWSGDGRTATFSMPNGALTATTDYVLQVDARDLAGNALTGLKSFAFKTAAPMDTTAPQVIGTSPAQGATDVSVSASPSVSFSEPMNASTVSTAFTVTPAISGGCSILPDANGSLFTCNHGQMLSPNTVYTVKIGPGAKDGAGNALAADFTFTFTTGTVPDTTAPTVVSTSPLNNSNGALQHPTFSVTFSEPMDQNLTQGAFSIAQPPSVPAGTFTWDATGKVMTFTLPGGTNFIYGQQVVWQLSSAAKDLAGNALAAQVFNVQVRRQATAMVMADATGNYNDLWLDFVGGGSSTSLDLRVGDNALNRELRSMVSFDLASAIPATAYDVTLATVTMRQTGLSGTPYSGTPPAANSAISVFLFGIVATPMLNYDDFDSTPICAGSPVQCSTSTNCGGIKLTTSTAVSNFTATVTKLADLGMKSTAKRLSLRLERRWSGGLLVGCSLVASDGDSTFDYASFSAADAPTDKPSLSVTYTYP
jgi:hypothetical protein